MLPPLDPIVDGPADGEPLFFIQGWPDDATLWQPTVDALKDRYRCVRVNMPGAGGVPSERRGYTTDEIVEALAQCIRRVSPQRPVTLVIHDWGAFWGYILHHRYPELVSRIAGLDVAPHVKLDAKGLVGAAAYQGWLATAFLVGGPVGDWMTRRLARAFRAPGRPDSIHAAMNYPYRNMFRELADGRARQRTRDYWPEVPLLYVYGAHKPFMFHSPRWLAHVERVGGEVVALDGGHWVPLHPAFPGLLAGWLEATHERASA